MRATLELLGAPQKGRGEYVYKVVCDNNAEGTIRYHRRLQPAVDLYKRVYRVRCRKGGWSRVIEVGVVEVFAFTDPADPKNRVMTGAIRVLPVPKDKIKRAKLEPKKETGQDARKE